ncbi:efflux RND transporter periplasmic adaptor subunit [Lutibacter sp. HS1-25]|uniref:efflux RND transporter periplasmic adaptor subunit n=1 Tax=Lutibacter sp. HS1-25 TaxID=2485000 RepID=UPI0010131CE9|nr:efflux RND transporter periplasmic adaptor subunit [Lutibacter sp. HS1-25]RXP57071.1 efflux RND transporter periplasmic adaptor subunit [Lutibacter sp. HS1-25]
MKKYIFKILFFTLIATVFTACDSSKKSNENKEINEVVSNSITISAEQFKYMHMELGKISAHNFTKGIKTNGFIDVPPSNKAMVSNVIGGYVKVSNLLIGDKVDKGQLLLTLENPDFIEIQQNFLEIQVSLNYLKSEYTRQKTLFDEKITSEKNYLKAESDYKTALAKYNGLEHKLRMLNINPSTVKDGKFSSTIAIYAPINGTISKVNTSVGKFMNESDVLLEIINDEHKHIELVIFEKDVLKVKEGQKIIFNLPENSAETFTGEVHLIGKAIDETNRTVKVHGHLEQENESFLVGMFVEAEIVTDEIEKIAIPSQAALEENGQYYILVLNKSDEKNYYFEKMLVKIGLKDEEWTEILDAEATLKDKDILIKGAFIPVEAGSDE